MGKVEKRIPYTTHTIDVKEGQSFYLFSDGFPDQFGGERNKKYSYKRLRELLLSVHTKPMDEQRTILESTFEDWKGDKRQTDDVCVMGIRL